MKLRKPAPAENLLTGYQEREKVKPCAPQFEPGKASRGLRRSTITTEQQHAHALHCAASGIADKAARIAKAATERRREQKRRSARKHRA